MAGTRTFKIQILGTSADAQRAIDGVRHASGQLARSTETLGSKLARFAKYGLLVVAAAAAAAAYKIGEFAIEAVKDAEAAEAVDRTLGQVAQSMGLFGAETSQVVERLKDYASTLQHTIAVDDESIKQVQTKLLTFKELARTAGETGGMFDRATVAAHDLAAAGFGEAATNAVQLGKALQDPIKGITALARSGVTFTEVEREKIKALVESNRVGEAQALIMGAIEKQVGGAAAANATATQKMSIAWGDFKEKIGAALLPALQRLADWITTKIIPAFEVWWADAGPKVEQSISDIANWIINDLAPALKDLWRRFSEDVLPVLVQYVEYVRQHVIPIIGDIVGNLGRLGDMFSDTSGKSDNLKTAMGIVSFQIEHAGRVMDVVRTVLQMLTGGFLTVVGVIKTVIEWFVGLWQTAFKVKDSLVEAGAALIRGFIGGITTAWRNGINFFLGLPAAIIGFVSGLPGSLLGRGRETIAGLWDGIKQKWEAAKDWLGGLGERVKTTVGDLGSKLWNAGKEIIDGFLRGLREKWEDVKSFVGGLGNWIAEHKGPLSVDRKLLIPAGLQIMHGLQVGLEGGAPPIQRMLHDFTGNLAPTGSSGAATRGQTSIVINVNAAASNPAEVGRQVVDAIRAYERSNGSVFRAA